MNPKLKKNKLNKRVNASIDLCRYIVSNNLVILVTPDHRLSHWSLLRSKTSTMMAWVDIMALCNLVTLVTPGHIEVMDINNDGLDQS